MKDKKASLILALFATLALAFMAMAQETAPTPPAEATSTQSEASTKSTSGDEMPATASPLALVALMGVGSLGAGVVAHRYSKRLSTR